MSAAEISSRVRRLLEVLRGVDFDVARGSIFALLGSNGAGKTTVVKICPRSQGGRGDYERQRSTSPRRLPRCGSPSA